MLFLAPMSYNEHMDRQTSKNLHDLYILLGHDISTCIKDKTYDKDAMYKNMYNWKLYTHGTQEAWVSS